ncbi:hypothetical protein KUCAC02_016921, partial [Chaenocephalus aceratus]
RWSEPVGTVTTFMPSSKVEELQRPSGEQASCQQSCASEPELCEVFGTKVLIRGCVSGPERLHLHTALNPACSNLRTTQRAKVRDCLKTNC